MPHKFEKNIEYTINLSGKEPEFFMKIGFNAISETLLSVAHRKLSNRGSGLIWDKKTRSWMRIVNGLELSNAYEENKENTRIYHDTYEEHIEALKLRKKGLDFIVISNGNLGNNKWYVAWQRNEPCFKLYALHPEPNLLSVLQEGYIYRDYSCFVVPREGDPRIQTLNFRFEDILDKNGRNISDEVNWCTYGQQIVRNSKFVPIEEIIEQFYDVRHVFDLKDWIKDKNNEEERAKIVENFNIISELYEGYPTRFREKMLDKLKGGFPRAKYYHSTLGISEEGIVLYHYKDKIEEIGKRLVDKGVKDSIIMDQGGSVGTYASWVYPNGGYLSTSSYFRPNRISVIVFVFDSAHKSLA